MKAHFTLQLSEFFNRVVSFDYFVIKHLIRKVFGRIGPRTVLDLGCGAGTLSVLFPPKKYLGIDLDERLIDFAKKNHPEYLFCVGNATEIRLERKFDIVLVVGVLHHLNNKDCASFIETIYAHLKKDGKALIIEAIPPLWRWNILGHIIRAMDKGAFIRRLPEYKRMAQEKFKIVKAYDQRGGIVDYAVLVLSHKGR